MSVPDEEIRRKVTQWLAYGDEDLRLARHGLTLVTNQPFRLIAYHAQQCAEKYLKGYLVSHRIDFPYTHNISRLVELSVEQGLEGETLHDAEELTPFAITARYPGEDEEVTEEEALRAIDIAARVLRNREARLKDRRRVADALSLPAVFDLHPANPEARKREH